MVRDYIMMAAFLLIASFVVHRLLRRHRNGRQQMTALARTRPGESTPHIKDRHKMRFGNARGKAGVVMKEKRQGESETLKQPSDMPEGFL